MKNFLGLLKKVVPWVVAVLIFVYLFNKYKPSQIYQSLKYVNVLYFFGLAAIYFIFMYLVDCKTVSMILTRFGYPIPTRDVLPGRGVTYLIMTINYPAAQAAFAYYLRRTHKVPIFEGLGVFFFVAFIDLYILMAVAFVGTFFQEAIVRGVDVGSYVRWLVVIGYVGFVLNLLFWRRFKFFRWLRNKKLFHVFKEALVKDYLKTAVYRLPIHVAIIFFLYAAISTFNAHLPFATVMSTIPIVFLIGTIPITPGGLGTTNVAMVELLSPYITSPIIDQGIVTAQEMIFTLTILWMFANYFLKAIFGAAWLMKVSTKLFRPVEEVPSCQE